MLIQTEIRSIVMLVPTYIMEYHSITNLPPAIQLHVLYEFPHKCPLRMLMYITYMYIKIQNDSTINL